MVITERASARGEIGALVKVGYYHAEREQHVSYDANGNRTGQTIREGTFGTVRDIQYSYYPNSNLVKSDGTYAYRYDGAGNLIEKGSVYVDRGTDVDIEARGDYWAYAYDLLNRLEAVRRYDPATQTVTEIARYHYDARGYRIESVVDGVRTEYAYDLSGNIIERRVAHTRESFVWIGGKLFARIRTGVEGTRTAWMFTDQVGTTVLATDDAGTLVWEQDITAFGTQGGQSGYWDLDQWYTGKEYERATGLYYFNARWYDPDLGRFITEDPARDGVNWYAYVGNNPLTFVDPTGMLTDEHRQIMDELQTNGAPDDVIRNARLSFEAQEREQIDTLQGLATGEFSDSWLREAALGIADEYKRQYNRDTTPIWPTASRRVTSVFGPRHPSGIDIGGDPAGQSEPVVASQGGVISFVGVPTGSPIYSDSGSTYVIIQGDDGLEYRYVHMNSLVEQSVGTRIIQGEYLGMMGTEGTSAMHLHFEMIKRNNGINEKLNPLIYLPFGAIDEDPRPKQDLPLNQLPNIGN